MISESLAIVVLGMHRSGTSCLAGMLAAGGLASAGDAVRNWDNARGHHEMLDAVRLNEAVLAHSGGHWLSPPAEVRWTDEQAVARDRLLRARIDGRPALLKDPRTLLTLPFWRASRVPYHSIGIVRHPLAVARSLESWRGVPLAEGVALWSSHNRALADDHARRGYALVDFEQPKAAVVAAVRAACAPLAPVIDPTGLRPAPQAEPVGSPPHDSPRLIDEAGLAGAYEEHLVHHDDGDAPAVAGLDEAVALYRRLAGAGTGEPAARPAFPRAELAAFERLLREGVAAAALQPARAALASVADAAAVLVPVVTSLLRRRAHAEARALIAEHAARLDDGLADLLHGKVLLALGDAAGAVRHLEAACAVARPFFQARHLLPQALRGAGRSAEARAAMRRAASEALYPHGPLATLAEWSWLDGDPREALAEMQQAIAAAPLHRRGRLRTRRAEWLLTQGDPVAARAELLRALDEDPGYGRSREVLASLA
jgi:Flp pilus assembly protein TadD